MKDGTVKEGDRVKFSYATSCWTNGQFDEIGPIQDNGVKNATKGNICTCRDIETTKSPIILRMKYKVGDVLESNDYASIRTVIAVIEPSCYVLEESDNETTLYSEKEMDEAGWTLKGASIKEMTVKEISDKLGYEVKVVK